MTTAQILREFKPVAIVRADGKHRVCLGKIRFAHKAAEYKLYTSEDGLIILDPQVSIPAREAWLFKNKKALKSVRSGLDDLKAGRAHEAKEDFTKYIDEK